MSIRVKILNHFVVTSTNSGNIHVCNLHTNHEYNINFIKDDIPELDAISLRYYIMRLRRIAKRKAALSPQE